VPHRARSATTGAPTHGLLPFLSLHNLARRDLTGGADLGARPQPFFTFSPFRSVSNSRAGAGRLSERYQSAVG
jgi:hypothetical protein